jgi:hypothetical protein
MGPTMRDCRCRVPEWQLDGEREVTLTIKNMSYHLEPMPSPSARPARRCVTAPGSLLATALESSRPRAGGDGDSSWALSWKGDLLDDNTFARGAPEHDGDGNHETVADETEMKIMVEDTVYNLKPVVSELSLRTQAVDRNNTAPKIPLAVVSARDTPHLGSEDCAEGFEDEGANAVTRAPSYGSSSTECFEMYDAERSTTMEKKKKKKGLREPNGRRPGKSARKRYQNIVASLQDSVRQDPSFSVESFPLPQKVLDNDALMLKLAARVEAARPVAD